MKIKEHKIYEPPTIMTVFTVSERVICGSPKGGETEDVEFEDWLLEEL